MNLKILYLALVAALCVGGNDAVAKSSDGDVAPRPGGISWFGDAHMRMLPFEGCSHLNCDSRTRVPDLGASAVRGSAPVFPSVAFQRWAHAAGTRYHADIATGCTAIIGPDTASSAAANGSDILLFRYDFTPADGSRDIDIDYRLTGQVLHDWPTEGGANTLVTAKAILYYEGVVPGVWVPYFTAGLNPAAMPGGFGNIVGTSTSVRGHTARSSFRSIVPIRQLDPPAPGLNVAIPHRLEIYTTSFYAEFGVGVTRFVQICNPSLTITF